MLFQANIECVERQGTPLTHPEAAGGCGAREGGRVESTKVVMVHVLRGAEMSSGRPKNAFINDFLFTFGRLVGDIGWFSALNRPPSSLNMPSQKNQLRCRDSGEEPPSNAKFYTTE